MTERTDHPEAYEDAAHGDRTDIRSGDIAVIGVHGRFPGARDCDEFWRRISAGDDCVTFHSDDELRAAGVPEALLADERYVRTRGGLDEPYAFDHEFFGYSAREGELIDPQQRIFLETAWELLETIGYAGDRDGQPVVGVFAGSSMNTYLTNVLGRTVDLLSLEGTELMLTNDKDYLPTRVSYKLGLRGPSVNVQTGCSTSLVAVHLAAQSLTAGECDVALAGGVSVHVGPRPGYLYQDGLMFSPDGRCRPFDAQASGTAFGDGVGIAALKRLGDAIEDGDRVLAVVRGTAVNNDGARKVGFAAPGVAGQRDVIGEAHAVAEVDSRGIGMLEAHGTGTALGDPVEFAALREVFGADTQDTGFCALGSVKANVGHLAGAAGIAGFIKTVLALHHGKIPPHPHFTRPLPELGLDDSPFYINDKPVDWPADQYPRRAGVSSFGMGGTNAHVVLEEAPAAAGPAPARAGVMPELVPVSATTPTALVAALTALSDRLEAPDAPPLADVALTLRTGRRAFPYRYAVRGTTHGQVAAQLRAAAGLPHDRAVDFAAPVTLVVGGGGTPLEEIAPPGGTVRARLERAEQLLTDRGVAAEHAGDAVAGALNGRPRPEVAELAFFLSAHTLAVLWTRSGLRPAAVAGAGTGELAAACATGVLPLGDVLALLAARAGLLDTAGGQEPTLPTLRIRPGSVPFFSAVHGRQLDPATTGVRHWAHEALTSGTHLAEAVTAAESGAGAEPGSAPDGIVLALSLNAREAEAIGALGLTPARLLTVPGATAAAGLLPTRLLDAAGRLWSAGADVDWSAWWGGTARRVPLPTHPLRRRRLIREPDAPADTAPRRSDAPEQWLHTESWQRSGTVRDVVRPPAAGSSWLIFEDRSGVGERLRTALAAHGVEAMSVQAGERYERTGPNTFTVDPADADGHRELLTHLAQRGSLPDRIVHLWSLDDAAGPADDGRMPTPAQIERAQQLGLYSLLDTAAALGRARRTGTTRISVVARGLFDVLGGEPLAPATSTVTAAARVIPQEYAGVTCDVLDPGTGPLDAGALLAELTAEPSAGETVVALRRGHRWRQVFQQIGAERAAEGASPLRQGGVYLITGGLGAVGLTLAANLARRYGARLVLTGRTAVPEPAACAAWLDVHGPDHPQYATVAALRELATVAGGLMTAAADVTDRAAMADVVTEATRRFGRVDGWFHAAGVPLSDAVQWIGATGRDDWRATLAPKVLGALVLEDVFAGQDLDFGCMVSSLSSVVGGMGYAAYAAANTFLDTVALGRRNRFSVDWEGWDVTAAEGTPSGPATPAAQGTAWQELRALALRPAEGNAAFDLVMRHTAERRIAVSTVDLETRRRRWARPLDEAPDGASAPSSADAPDLGPGLEQRLAEVWGEVLRTEVDQYDRTIFDMGGDSLLLVELALRIEARLGIPLQATDLLAAPTVDHLAARIRADADGTPDGDSPADDSMAKAEQRADLRSRRRAARRDSRKDRDA
ncbi:SDR family oxidoreductase [Streptomyces sp. NBC_01092]|uniref:type I polyketide synthase n=1 Tax=Streptomyces sp. NBC_01092 TaxID=2903748 RepID=UPI00386C2286|nr:SDR family oxidoreductase [Streptomyces sp. NBC_01092]